MKDEGIKITLNMGTMTECPTALDLYRFLDNFTELELTAMYLKVENHGEEGDLEFNGVLVEDEQLTDGSIVHNLIFVVDLPDYVSDETRSNGPRR